MPIGLLGKKLGMTHVYDQYGRRRSVTVVQRLIEPSDASLVTEARASAAQLPAEPQAHWPSSCLCGVSPRRAFAALSFSRRTLTQWCSRPAALSLSRPLAPPHSPPLRIVQEQIFLSNF